MKITLLKLIAAAVLSLSAATTFAAKVDDAPAAACEGLKVATGPKGKGYSKLYSDVAKACGAEINLCEVATNGGLDNLNAMSTKDADIGIAQLDTWATMKAGDENVAGLQGVMGMNYNYLHVVTAANGFKIAGEKKWGGLTKEDDKQVSIQRFSELRGRKVALVGSAQLLGRQLDRHLAYGMQLVDVDTDQKAFDLVRTGTVAAALSVSGWPHGALKALKQDSGLSLVPFDAPASNGQVVRPINYKGLGVYNNNALAMPNVLFTRPFKGDKAAEVGKLKSCVTAKLQELQEGSYEPGWNEIKDPNNTFDVPKFSAPAGAVKTAAPAPGKKKG